jgi:hypothetical protein
VSVDVAAPAWYVSRMAMAWQLSDGTGVTSDGKAITVTGDSAFARYLRYRLTSGDRILVPEYAAPTETPLNPASAHNIDAWLLSEISWEDADIIVASRPEIPPTPKLVGARDDVDADTPTVY